MEKLTTAQQRARHARLLMLSPVDASRELELYGDRLRSEPHSGSNDTELELAMLERRDRLINLALARNAEDPPVLGSLYALGTKPAENSEDARYKAALRISCLANCAAGHSAQYAFPTSWMPKADLLNLVTCGDLGECDALLSNPVLSDAILIELYRRQESFESTSDERWIRYIGMSSRNPRLVTEIDYPDAPDFGFIHIHEALVDMLGKFPLKGDSSFLLFGLLRRLNPFLVPAPSSAASLRTMLESWRGATLIGFGNKEQEGFYTDLSMREELRCLAASLYAKAHERTIDGKWHFVPVGDANADDIAFRCAAYATTALTPEIMSAHFQRDGLAFTLAALGNVAMYTEENRRFLEENALQGRLIRLYAKRCDQYAKKFPSFSVYPVTEMGRQLTAFVEPAISQRRMANAAESTEAVEALVNRVDRLKSLVILGFAIIIVLILWKR